MLGYRRNPIMTSAAELKDLIQIAIGAAPKNITLWTESDQVVQCNLLTFLSNNAIRGIRGTWK